MKRILFLFYLLATTINVSGQIAQYNNFPTLRPSHILDEKLTDISFAFSMRVLESDYNGALIRLRRDSDNLEEDFFCNDNDIVDVDAINTWRNGANVFVTVWYDQSGLNRNAVQNINNRQPRFYPVATTPYFQGDGSNDHLTVDTPNGIQDVTNNGNEGTVLAIMRATRRGQHTFGVLVNSNRWSAHANWSNNRLYFDPGICCNNPRSFNNGANINIWRHYSFIKTNTNILGRVNGNTTLSGIYTLGRCTRREDFAIGWATGNQRRNHATTSFMEFIMYKTDIIANIYEEIEENAITFWSL